MPNDLQQKRFRENLAHELRTHLAILKTSTEVALMNPALTDEVITVLTQVLSEVNDMSDIVVNMLSSDRT
jgi:signal transduction histidine kinase